MRLGGERKGAGLAALHKGMQAGSPRDRAFAISMAPIKENGFRELIEKLAEDAEPDVKIAALVKLSALAETSAEAKKKLGELAISKEPGFMEARAAMARIGDRRVIRLLLDQAKKPDPKVRESTMSSFMALDDLERAAFFLADPDPSLRMNTACSLLVALSGN
jgi:HEAT repeat protein